MFYSYDFGSNLQPSIIDAWFKESEKELHLLFIVTAENCSILQLSLTGKQ